MSTASRVWLLLAAFLVTAGAIYGFTSHEVAGAPLLVVASAVFFFLGLVARREARRLPSEEAEGPAAGQDLVHVGPTIWPLGFAIAGIFLVFGLIVTKWLLIVGAALFALAAAGWLRAVSIGHRHAGEA